jgi:hypothetical protein
MISSIEGSKKFKNWIKKFKQQNKILFHKIPDSNLEAICISIKEIPYCIVYCIDSKIEYLSIGVPIPIQHDGSVSMTSANLSGAPANLSGVGGEIRPCIFKYKPSENKKDDIINSYIDFNTFIKKNKETIETIEDLILKDISSKKIKFDIYIVDNGDSKQLNKYMELINSRRIGILSLAIQCILINSKLSLLYPKSIVEKFNYIDSATDIVGNYIGAEIINALTIQEDYNTQKMYFNTWRDLIVANSMSICKSKKIIPSTLSTGHSFYRYGSTNDYFNNKYIDAKYKISDQIEAIDNEYEYYANNFNIMADITLGYNILLPLRSSNKKPKLVECNLFELLYTTWYLHSQFKIVHTKLQNSILIGDNGNNDGVNLYITEYDGEKDTYVFDVSDYNCEIYNYGASIIMLNCPLIDNKLERIPYDNSQLSYVILVIKEFIKAETLTPEIIRESIREKDHWYDIFNVIAVKDYIDICNFILDHSDNKKTIKLCNDIIKECSSFIKSGLDDIVNKSKRPEETYNLIWDRIKDIFSDYHYSACTGVENKKINNIFKYDEIFDIAHRTGNPLANNNFRIV